MRASPPRVAYFPDSFHEINGVAHTSRNFVAYAERHELPMLCVRAAAGSETGAGAAPYEQRGSVEVLELPRSAFSVPLERDLRFDPLFFRYSTLIEQALLRFRPDVVHITGPSELGIFGAYFAWKLGIPLAASWHTNVHEYAARRTEWLTRLMGDSGPQVERGIEAGTLDATARFYRLAKVLYAPNPQLCELLAAKTGRPCHLMQRGVEADVFSPAKRTRAAGDGRLVLGFVGRLSVEKNVALLPVVDRDLRARGLAPEWLIVGHGSEEAAVREALRDHVTMPGVLRGEMLAEAYANMDAFVFPSHTDTFGNVVLEALASGVPAVVTPDGGPATIVQDGVTGRVAADADFGAAIAGLLGEPGSFAGAEAFAAMRSAARAYALTCSWNAVFDRVYGSYPLSR